MNETDTSLAKINYKKNNFFFFSWCNKTWLSSIIKFTVWAHVFVSDVCHVYSIKIFVYVFTIKHIFRNLKKKKKKLHLVSFFRFFSRRFPSIFFFFCVRCSENFLYYSEHFFFSPWKNWEFLNTWRYFISILIVEFNKKKKIKITLVFLFFSAGKNLYKLNFFRWDCSYSSAVDKSNWKNY